MVIWFILFIVMLVIELLTVNLVSIWFALGALCAMITSLITNSIIIQLIVFVIVTVISLLSTKKIVKKLRRKEKIPTNLDAVIGKTAIVTEDIHPLEVGEVKVAGKKWSAISEDKILKDSKVIVEKIDGVKLIVKKKEEK